MATTYLPAADDAKVTWLNNFAAKLPQQAAKYGISDADVQQLQADAAWWERFVAYRRQFAEFSTALTKYRNAMSSHTGTEPVALSIPAPNLPAAPPPGIFARVASVANKIKGDKVYSEADGRDLGLIGAAPQLPDAATHRPLISTRAGAGGMPEIVWSKGSMSALLIQRQDAAGHWQLLGIDTSPNYIDNSPLATPGTPENRKYRAIYLLHDEQYGQWSDVVSFTVG